MIDLIFYDIEKDRLRTKAAKLLKKHGYVRIQYSVFLGNCRKSTRRTVVNKLRTLLEKSNPDLNKVYCIELHADRIHELTAIGTPPALDVILGKVKTMIW